MAGGGWFSVRLLLTGRRAGPERRARRSGRRIATMAMLAALLGSSVGVPAAAAPGDSSKPAYRVFVFYGGAPAAIADAGSAAIRRAGKERNFAVEASADAGRFTTNQLMRF